MTKRNTPILHKFKKGGILIYKKSKRKHTCVLAGFKIGSAINGKNKGYAHFLEHLMLEGPTATRTKEKLLEDKLKIAPNLNASTSSFSTMIKFFRTNALLEQSLELASDLLLNPGFGEKEVKKEAGVIQEELRLALAKNEDNLDYISRFTLFKKPSAYAISTTDALGSFDDLKNMKLESLKSFRAKHYNLNNFIAVVSSSISFKKIKKMIEKYFINKLNFNENYHSDQVCLDVNKKENLSVTKSDKDKLSIDLTFKLNHSFDKTELDYSFEILNSWFSAGINSLLGSSLRAKGLIYHLKSTMRKELSYVLYNIQIYTSKNKFEDVINVLNQSIKQIKETLISNSLLQNIKNNIIYLKDERQPQNILTTTSELLKNYLHYGKFKRNPSSQKLGLILNKITPQKINQQAKEFFSPDTPLYITILGNVEKDEIPSHKSLKKKILLTN